MYEILTYASMNYYKWILSFSLFIFKYKKAFFYLCYIDYKTV